jgi:hypothetical protein
MILRNLLSLPRIRIKVANEPFPTYLRSLDIPEYQGSFAKRLPAKTALYTKLWLSDAPITSEEALWLHVPEETFYADIGIGDQLPRLSELIRMNNVTNIESEGLICLPALESGTSYEKGISLRRNGTGVEVGGISVDYESSHLSGGGVAMGYQYELVEDRLVRKKSASDCPCGDPARHNLHLRALAAVEDLLATGNIRRLGNVMKVTMKDYISLAERHLEKTVPKL